MKKLKLTLKFKDSSRNVTFTDKVNYPCILTELKGNIVVIKSDLNIKVVSLFLAIQKYTDILDIEYNGLEDLSKNNIKKQIAAGVLNATSILNGIIGLPDSELTECMHIFIKNYSLYNLDVNSKNWVHFENSYNNITEKYISNYDGEKHNPFKLNEAYTKCFRKLLFNAAKDLARQYSLPVKDAGVKFTIDRFTGEIHSFSDLPDNFCDQYAVFASLKDAQKAIYKLKNIYQYLFGTSQYFFTQKYSEFKTKAYYFKVIKEALYSLQRQYINKESAKNKNYEAKWVHEK